MDSIRAWALALCAVAVACSLLHLIAPKNGMGKIFKMLLAAFFLCCLITPLLSLKDMLHLDIASLPDSVAAETLQERVNEQVLRQIDASLLRVTNSALKNYGVQAEKVEAKTDTSADGGICITQIVLYLDKQNIRHAIAAKQVLEDRLETPVIVQEAA